MNGKEICQNIFQIIINSLFIENDFLFYYISNLWNLFYSVDIKALSYVNTNYYYYTYNFLFAFITTLLCKGRQNFQVNQVKKIEFCFHWITDIRAGASEYKWLKEKKKKKIKEQRNQIVKIVKNERKKANLK